MVEVCYKRKGSGQTHTKETVDSVESESAAMQVAVNKVKSRLSSAEEKESVYAENCRKL
jgi:hypothetical protein